MAGAFSLIKCRATGAQKLTFRDAFVSLTDRVFEGSSCICMGCILSLFLVSVTWGGDTRSTAISHSSGFGDYIMCLLRVCIVN